MLPVEILLVIVRSVAAAVPVTDNDAPVNEYVAETVFADTGPVSDIALNEGDGLDASTH
jgi:hypothetical protein